MTKCGCERETHGRILDSCIFSFFGQIGPPPFNVLELKTRLRRYNNLIEYKGCVYDGEEANTTDISNFLESRMVEVLPSINDSDDASESSEEEDASSDLEIFDDGGDLSLTPDALELINSTYDSDSDTVQTKE